MSIRHCYVDCELSQHRLTLGSGVVIEQGVLLLSFFVYISFSPFSLLSF